ncbi:hypothetical protein [Vallitalea guaymasensis]|uniref:Uncharacterized protein n=1 Tax=Vallitalea guaymasensis TaxID=1185412 RepID=A0A8J8SDS0_9FIRM|nr:hypothetical protein [Vallitalea guaymasensis]QUH31117.1 hypothetical protein HYG85_20205 [Vallitalea guaymasensis]
MLKSALKDDKDINKIFGITNISEPSAFNIAFPYTLLEVAKQLGYDYWSYANDLINRITKETGINIKSSDNKYHISICKYIK